MSLPLTSPLHPADHGPRTTKLLPVNLWQRIHTNVAEKTGIGPGLAPDRALVGERRPLVARVATWVMVARRRVGLG